MHPHEQIANYRTDLRLDSYRGRRPRTDSAWRDTKFAPYQVTRIVERHLPLTRLLYGWNEISKRLAKPP